MKIIDIYKKWKRDIIKNCMMFEMLYSVIKNLKSCC